MIRTLLAAICVGGFSLSQIGCGATTDKKMAKTEPAKTKATKTEAKPTQKLAAPASNQVTRIDPSKEKNCKSPDDDLEVILMIENRRPSAVSLHWLDYDGDRVHYTDLEPSESVEQITFQGHFWIVLDENEKALGIYETPAKDAEITIK
jgi:hypothetical protein